MSNDSMIAIIQKMKLRLDNITSEELHILIGGKMSKWTLQKILDCEEIGFGTLTKGIGGKRLVINKESGNFVTVTQFNGHRVWGNSDDVTSLTFYRPDGTEILPPKEKVKRVATLLMAKKDQESGSGLVYDVIKGQLIVAQGEDWDTDLWQEVKVLPCGKIEVEE